MPRKPKRVAPDVGASAQPIMGPKAGAGTKPTAGAKAAMGTKVSLGARTSVGAKTTTGAKTTAGAGGVPGTRGDLSRVQVEAIRQLALDLARKGAAEPGTVMICNPISEPSALPAKELLYDRCGWCNTDIYYDRLMPSPPDLKRVCLACGILLLEAEKKGAN